jgi:hypothetical protein
MSNTQLYLAIGVPIIANLIFNGVLFGLLWSHMNSRFDAVDKRFEAVNQRFDDMRDLWRAELQRVEASWGTRIVQLEKTR